MNVETSYDVLEEIACNFYNYLPVLSEFKCLGYDDGSYVVEVNEVGKTQKRLRVSISVEEL